MRDKSKTLRLIPMEGQKEVRTISLEVAKLSLTLKEMIDSSDQREEQTSIPLPIPMELMDKMVIFLEYHFDDPIEDIDFYLDENAIQEMTEWDRHLMDGLTIDKIFKVMAFAEYLQIERLKDVCKKSIDSRIDVLNNKQLKKLSRMPFRPLLVQKKGQNLPQILTQRYD